MLSTSDCIASFNCSSAISASSTRARVTLLSKIFHDALNPADASEDGSHFLDRAENPVPALALTSGSQPDLAEVTATSPCSIFNTSAFRSLRVSSARRRYMSTLPSESSMKKSSTSIELIASSERSVASCVKLTSYAACERATSCAALEVSTIARSQSIFAFAPAV